MSDLTLIADHDARAKVLLVAQYKDSANFNKLVSCFTGEVQAAENVLLGLLITRTINNAVGVQLDNLGVLVGLARAGLTDTSYRVRLRVQILLNISSGTPDQIYAIFQLACASDGSVPLVVEEFPAAVIVRLGSVATTLPIDMAAILGKARDAGVRGILEYLATTIALSFQLDGTGAQALDNGAFGGALEGA